MTFFGYNSLFEKDEITASLPPGGHPIPDDMEKQPPASESLAHYGPDKPRSHADVAKKDIHLFRKLQHHEKPLKLKPIKIDHFEIRNAQPLQQPLIVTKDCYYLRNEQKCNIDTPTSVSILHADFDTFNKNYIQHCLTNNDNDMTKTRQDLVLKQALLFIQSLNIDEQQEKVILCFFVSV